MYNIATFIAIAAASVALALLRVTGMTIHIVVSVAALALMLVLTIKGKKEWKVSALEIGYRAMYAIAMLTGIGMMVASVPAFVPVLHKVTAGLFAVLYVCCFAISKKK